MSAVLACAILLTGLAMSSAHAEDPVLLHAAGSLRAALDDVSAAFAAASGLKVRARYGPSGTLREEIAAGAPAQVFASANMSHPDALARAGKASPVVLFARNRLCALTRPGLSLTPATLLDAMLDANVKLATSTPQADPSGDYAFEVFARAETVQAGSRARLEQKALQLTGGPSSQPAPAGRNAYAWHIAEGRADLFLTYCTNAAAAQRESPGQQLVALPEPLAVGADYGLTVLQGSPASAWRYALFVLSAEGQRILARHGFAAPGLAQETLR